MKSNNQTLIKLHQKLYVYYFDEFTRYLSQCKGMLYTYRDNYLLSLMKEEETKCYEHLHLIEYLGDCVKECNHTLDESESKYVRYQLKCLERDCYKIIDSLQELVSTIEATVK